MVSYRSDIYTQSCTQLQIPDCCKCQSSINGLTFFYLLFPFYNWNQVWHSEHFRGMNAAWGWLCSLMSHITPLKCMISPAVQWMLSWNLSPKDLQHPFAGWPNKPMSPLSACPCKPTRLLLVELLKARSSLILEKLFLRHLIEIFHGQSHPLGEPTSALATERGQGHHSAPLGSLS